MSAITGVSDAGISGNWSPITSRRVTAAAAGAPSYNISELHHHSSSNTAESPVKSFVLADVLILQPIYEIPYLQYHQPDCESLNQWVGQRMCC